jgi:hypothetical protein
MLVLGTFSWGVKSRRYSSTNKRMPPASSKTSITISHPYFRFLACFGFGGWGAACVEGCVTGICTGTKFAPQ